MLSTRTPSAKLLSHQPNSVCPPSVSLSQIQDLELASAQPHEVPACPFLLYPSQQQPGLPARQDGSILQLADGVPWPPSGSIMKVQSSTDASGMPPNSLQLGVMLRFSQFFLSSCAEQQEDCKKWQLSWYRFKLHPLHGPISGFLLFYRVRGSKEQ